jgi:hypothetical protein
MGRENQCGDTLKPTFRTSRAAFPGPDSNLILAT